MIGRTMMEMMIMVRMMVMEKQSSSLRNFPNLEAVKEVAYHTPVLKIGPAEHTDDGDGDDVCNEDDEVNSDDVHIGTSKKGHAQHL
jgi:hypothetical protein